MNADRLFETLSQARDRSLMAGPGWWPRVVKRYCSKALAAAAADAEKKIGD